MASELPALNQNVGKEPSSQSPTAPQIAPHSPLTLWCTCKPEALSLRDVSRLRKTLLGTSIRSEPDWNRAILGDAAVAIGIAVRQLKFHKITAPEVDLALSAVLACALEGNAAAAILISSALRRRSKKFRRCFQLSLLWLEAKF
jgi:hypothetical protein